MPYEFITTHRDGPIERLTLNRPELRNAFNDRVIVELTRWAEAIAVDRDVRVVVIDGAGKVFCAGADLSWMAQTAGYSREENERDAAAMGAVFTAIDALPVPVIGRIHGAALGGGAGLAAVCDIVVAEESTTFGFTEVKLGILPAVISPFAIAKIGRSAARELFLTGMRFDARRAREIGLVHAAVAAADLDATVDRYVNEILAAGRAAIAASKSLIRELWAATPKDVGTLTARAIAERRVSAEGQEGIRAFLEKRRASWNASH
jgi:methylglutaconyl-CoA hydratase